MIAPPNAQARILYSAAADPRALADAALSAPSLAAARALKLDRRSSVHLLPHSPAGPVVVKTIALRRPKDRLNALLRRTQSQRQIRGAALLQTIGVATAEPLLLIRGRGRETLILRAAPGRSLLHLLEAVARKAPDAPTFHQQRAIAAAIGAQLLRFDAAARFNRDHKPSNLIINLAASPPAVAVIDAVDIRRDRLKVGGMRMLLSLMLEPMGCGCPPPRTMRMRTLIAATTDERHPKGAPLIARKAAWRAVAQAIAEHGDPTPRVNPLA